MVSSCRVGGHSKQSQESFVRLVESHRPELRAHCQRMLRSPEDAEDAVQEALLRAWKGRSGFAGRGSARSWLFRIATNAALDTIKRRRERMTLPIEPQGGRPGLVNLLADEGSLTESRYEQREAVELALHAAQRILPAKQRAVLVLRAVFGFSAAETADMLGTTVASVNSALQRARATVDIRRPRLSSVSASDAEGAMLPIADGVAPAVSR
jgi:RNA polymerase sigma-70 factor, ECF subfamily